MARSKTFDVDEALDRALDVFWRRGYEAASMRELQQAMGIGRQSLYDTFGDKHALFVAAMERYNARQGVAVEDTLLGDDDGRDALRRWLDQLVIDLTPEGERPGCLLVNSILELGDDAEVADRCRQGRRDTERALRGALERVPGIDDVDRAATFLLMQAYGMTVLAKNGAPRAELVRLATMALDSLFAEGNRQ